MERTGFDMHEAAVEANRSRPFGAEVSNNNDAYCDTPLSSGVLSNSPNQNLLGRWGTCKTHRIGSLNSSRPAQVCQPRPTWKTASIITQVNLPVPSPSGRS